MASSHSELQMPCSEAIINSRSFKDRMSSCTWCGFDLSQCVLLFSRLLETSHPSIERSPFVSLTEAIIATPEPTLTPAPTTAQMPKRDRPT